MTTGDLRNNLRKFHVELKLINFANELDIEGLSVGKPSAFLPILHHAMTEFSFDLAQYFYSKDYELLGKNDRNFVSVVYRILRDEFNSKSPLTKEQFFTLGFAERKLQFATSVIQLCRKKSDVLKPKKKTSWNSAKSSKIHIPERTDSTTISTRHPSSTSSSGNSTLVTMAKKHASALSKDETDNAVVVSKHADGRSGLGNCRTHISEESLSNGQSVEDDVESTVIEDGNICGQSFPRNNQSQYCTYIADKPSCEEGQSFKDRVPEDGRYVTDNHEDLLRKGLVNAQEGQSLKDRVPKDGRYVPDNHEDLPRKGLENAQENMFSYLVQSGSEKLSNMTHLSFEGRHWDSPYTQDFVSEGSRNVYATKENICPNAGSAHNFRDLTSQSDQSLVLSPIPLSSNTASRFEPRSVKQITSKIPSNITRLNSQSPECSRHIFANKPNERLSNPLTNEDVDVSMLNKLSQSYAETLDYVKEQDRRIGVLRKEAVERDALIQELVGKNSKLNARVMVLETTVALLQEKIESSFLD